MIRPQAGAPWGELTLGRHQAWRSVGVHLHVFVNGEDVTSRCEFANDSPAKNFAVLFRLNESGHKFVEMVNGRHVAAREVVSGGVEIREGV